MTHKLTLPLSLGIVTTINASCTSNGFTHTGTRALRQSEMIFSNVIDNSVSPRQVLSNVSIFYFLELHTDELKSPQQYSARLTFAYIHYALFAMGLLTP
jgi:hypothetical protein